MATMRHSVFKEYTGWPS